MKRIIFLALLVGAGCNKPHNSGVLPGRNEKIMMQIICCAPGHISSTDAGTCAALKTVPENIETINGVRVWGTQSAASCINLDETPFWGEP